MAAEAPDFSLRYGWSGYLLGFALGGFFDGILLHQVLQWHHLFSALESDRFRDLRMQVMADGLFHMLMYVVLLTGLWLLWRTRQEFSRQGADRLLFANALIGFGVWHLLDALVSHWLLGIHRIRPESENPLLWDLLFFGLGMMTVALGYLLRQGGGLRCAQQTHIIVLAAAALAAGMSAAIPWRGGNAVTVVFPRNISAVEVFAAADAVDARLMWSNTNGDLWVFHLPRAASAWRLYRHGAYFVSGSYFGVGCFMAEQANRRDARNGNSTKAS